MPKLKLRAIIPNDEEHASAWWRIVKPFEMLRTLGHDAQWFKFEQLESEMDIDFTDSIVIIHRIIPGDPESYVLDFYARGAQKVIYSLDDYTIDPMALSVYLKDKGGMTDFQIDRVIKRIPRQLETIGLCDAILVSTLDLAELTVKFVKKSWIILPNAIDEEWFVSKLSNDPPFRENGNLVYIGWSGGRRPDSDFEVMAKAWQRIDKQFDNVRWVISGWQPDILDRHINLDKKIRIPWKPLETWPTSMQVDIGCCPLANTPFNKGKSPIKFQEFTLAGAAVVASSYVYEQEIVDYISGRIVDTEDEWFHALYTFITNKALRHAMCENAFYEIHRNRTLQVTINNWVLHLENLLTIDG